MKFPLAEHPFHAVQLTAEQCQYYEDVTAHLVDETIAEYGRFVHLENRTLNRRQWKPVKSRESLTVYKQTDRGLEFPAHRPGLELPASTSAVSSAVAATVVRDVHTWQLPKLLAVGTIVGTLDDVMYGISAPDVKSMLLRSSYVQDELVDGGVLAQLRGATDDDPFRFLGIKWYVKAHPTAMNTVVSPRDSVVIDATGVRDEPNGERIGYHVFHSVLLPECPELKSLSILRGYLSSCYLFKQTRNGTVEVYMKTYVDPGGSLPDAIATTSIANALIGCWKSVFCAQGKKLAWLIKNASARRLHRAKLQQRQPHLSSSSSSAQRVATAPAPTSTGKKYLCELCEGSFRAYKSSHGCQVCLRTTCGRCQTARKVSHMQRGLQVKQTSVVVCKNCITEATQLSAFTVARDEYVGKKLQATLTTDEQSYSSSDDIWAMSARSNPSSLADYSDSESNDLGSMRGGDANQLSGLQYASSEGSNSGSALVRTRSLGREGLVLAEDNEVPQYEEQLYKLQLQQQQCQQPQRCYQPDSLASTAMTVSTVSSSLSSYSESWQPSLPTSSSVEASSSSVDPHRQQLWMQMNQLRLAAEQTYRMTKQTTSAMRFSPSP